MLVPLEAVLLEQMQEQVQVQMLKVQEQVPKLV